MSKVEILRGIITDGLSTAAREILAVVERTVAGYEEEASGFKKETERQRRQLEVLLQPQVKLERTGFIPDVHSSDAVVDVSDEEEVQTQQTDPGLLDFLWYDEEEEGEGEEEEQLKVQQREDQKDPDFQISSNRSSSRPGSERRKHSRKQDRLQLRICVLEDSQTDVLTTAVFQKCPVQDLQCPPGLQEADFLSLLSSTFPQLDIHEPFEVFTTDRSRRLRPLRVQTLTPEEICRCMSSIGAGGSALYIRPKTAVDLQSSAAEIQKRNDEQSGPFIRVLPPEGLPEKRPRGRPPNSENTNHHTLRLCFLKEVQPDPLSKKVLLRSDIQKLRCPHGLQESDFVLMLRSRFPQLDGDRGFDLFTSDRSRALTPIRLTAMTPDEIYRSLKPYRLQTTIIYIRLRIKDEKEESHLLQIDDTSRDCPSAPVERTKSDEDELRFSSPKYLPKKKRPRGRPPLCESTNHHTLRLCFLSPHPLSKKVLLRSEVQQLQCSLGLQESDFLLMLRSRFPQLDGDGRGFDLFTSDRSRKLTPVPVTAMTPDEICRSLKSCRLQATMIYIRLKTEEEEEEEEELRVSHINDKTSGDSPSAAAAQTMSDEAELCLSKSPSRQEDMSTERPEKDCVLTDQGDEVVVLSHSDSDVDDGAKHTHDDDTDWRPQPQLQVRKNRRVQPPVEAVKTPCKVCGMTYRLKGSLFKHAWSHINEAPSVCAVCGEHFECVEDLKTHLKSHQKTHECSLCGKSFITVGSLKAHIARHSGEQRYKCDVCNKMYASMQSLTVHHWEHVAEKPHKCDVCHKEFGLKAQLRVHSRVHTGQDRFLCNICGKSLCDLRSLARHKATHSSERPYSCQTCGKRFKIDHTLKSHERIHTVRDQKYLCHICCKTFTTNCSLKVHLKTHSSDRPFGCPVCSKRFISNGQLKVHLRVHTGEAPYGCSQCGRHFKSKSQLNSHVRSHLGIKLYTCGVCGKACARPEHLKVHMRTHNGERPYKCSVCDKGFTQSHCLKTHMKTHQENAR